MKKATALLLAVLCLISMAACKKEEKGEGTVSQIPDSLTLLEKVWGAYAEDEKFACGGGSYDAGTFAEDAPGAFPVEDAALLNSTLGFPENMADKIDDAASLIHMMNANTFTCGAFRLKAAGDMDTVVEAVSENIANRRWMCGFPEVLVILTVDNYIVTLFGNQEMIQIFTDHMVELYPETRQAVTKTIE